MKTDIEEYRALLAHLLRNEHDAAKVVEAATSDVEGVHYHHLGWVVEGLGEPQIFQTEGEALAHALFRNAREVNSLRCDLIRVLHNCLELVAHVTCADCERPDYGTGPGFCDCGRFGMGT